MDTRLSSDLYTYYGLVGLATFHICAQILEDTVEALFQKRVVPKRPVYLFSFGEYNSKEVNVSGTGIAHGKFQCR